MRPGSNGFERLVFAAVCTGLLGLSAVGCSREPDAAVAAPPPNVVLIVIDTLRADRLGCYGYERQTSPNIDSFAARAALYQDCVSTAPWTLPAHASIFTGKYPFEHGAVTIYPTRPGMWDAYALAPRNLTLAEALRDEGYVTAAFVANATYCGKWTRLNQGFDTYYTKYVYASELVPRVLAWLEQPRSAPFFLFVNFMDTHRPYNVAPRPGFIDPPADPDVVGLSQQFTQNVFASSGPLSDELQRKIIDQYDTAVANVDQGVGAVLQALRAHDAFDNTVIVITSDHGQYLGEHRLVGHSKDVYQEALKVPLIIKGPGSGVGRTIAKRVSLAMIPELICERMPSALDQRVRARFPDRSQTSFLLASNRFSRAKDLSQPWGDRFKRVRRVVFSGQYKYIHSSDGQHELYDLEADPRESRNLVEVLPDVAARMAEALASLRTGQQPAPDTDAPSTPLSPDELRMMAQLGYIDAPDNESDEQP